MANERQQTRRCWASSRALLRLHFDIQAARALLSGTEGGPEQAGRPLERRVAVCAAAEPGRFEMWTVLAAPVDERCHDEEDEADQPL